MTEKPLPSSRETEQTVLSLMTFEPESTIKQVVSAGDGLFYYPEYEVIRRAIYELYEEGEVIDQVTISEWLEKDDKLKLVGGMDMIGAITIACPSNANLNGHIELLKKKRALRSLISTGHSIETICQMKKPDPKDVIVDITSQLHEIQELLTETKLSLAARINEWISGTKGDFYGTELDKELFLGTQRDKENRKKILQRLAKEGVIERASNRHSHYRILDSNYENIDWRNAKDETVELYMPMGIERYVEIMPGNIIVIAGEQNAGKTAFLLNVIEMNMRQHKIHYFNSEMGAPELKKRLMKFGIPIDDWNFKAWERSSEFADVIFPNDVNIIDFMEIHDDFYKVGLYIKQIHDRLKKGIAFIALQKNKGRDEGRGGSMSLEKPRLYIALEPNKCKIIKAKNWKVDDKNPNGLEREFKLVQGCKFISTTTWGKP